MKDKILAILSGINGEISKNPEVNLLSSGIIDSFEIVNLVVELEEAFDIEIDPELVVPDNFQTLDAIVKMVEGIVNQ